MLRTTLLFVFVGLAISVSTSGFRANKHSVHHLNANKLSSASLKHSTSKVNHMDLEEEVTPERDFERVESEIDSALRDMASLTTSFEKVKHDLESFKVKTIQPEMHVNHDEPLGSQMLDDSSDKAEEDKDSFDSVSLLELPFDDMNNDMDDDDAPVPQLMQRMNSRLIQSSTAKNDEPVVFGVKATPEGPRTYDVTPDGDLVLRPVIVSPSPPPTKPDAVPKPAAPPINETSDNDVVCVCKRHNSAPRGADRIRCKRHPISPSPSPSPVVVVEGIRQCANGTWVSGGETGSRDVICIYFPAVVPAPPTPPPMPSPEPEYPPECYDDRNEFVADEVIERRRFDVLLLQQGFETCGCDK